MNFSVLGNSGPTAAVPRGMRGRKRGPEVPFRQDLAEADVVIHIQAAHSELPRVEQL